MSGSIPPRLPPSVPPALPPSVSALSYAPPSARDDILEIAKAQRKLMFCILAYLGSYLLIFASLVADSPVLILVAIAAILCAMVFAIMLIFRLSRLLYSTITAVLFVIGLFVPLVNFLVLLSVSLRATNILRRNGYKVGLMGVSADQLQSRAHLLNR